MKKVFLLICLPIQLWAQSFSSQEIKQYQSQAQRVNIIRDQYGVPHIYGKSDADAVFGLLFAQCEDDFKRVELNYIEKLGRLSEINGAKDLYEDLMIRLLIDSAEAKKDYNNAPAWLKKLCDAFAAGINFYLYTHPQVQPLLLKKFEPWFPMLWTDGSIGAISTGGFNVNDLKNVYGNENLVAYSKPPIKFEEELLTGSNGFAFAPSITESGKAILYINPHVTFYFRPEVHVISEEGLNAYGAVTWGQMFVYQGFNEKCGWMHTSSQADIADTYIEKLSKQNNEWVYEYEGALKPVKMKTITIAYKENGQMLQKSFNAMYTHHGPIVAKRNQQYISLKHNNRDKNGLIQSWLRTKATSFDAFKKTMDLRANPSNNTVYADAEGNIAYWHGNFMPKRNASYDWSKPVDGTTAATEWQGLHTVDEMIHIYNPANGWIQNCNATPFTAAGKFSPSRENYPKYMAPDGENFRGLNAVRVLEAEKKFTIDKVIKAGYNTFLTSFELLVPALIKAYDEQKSILDEYSIQQIKDAMNELRNWNFYSSENSVATTIAVEWGQKVWSVMMSYAGEDQVEKAKNFAANAKPQEMLLSFYAAIQECNQRWGTWKKPWGEINRFQRISSSIDQVFDDTKPSYPVAYTSSQWGMLPSYTSRYFNQTKKRYGVNGNSFVAVVEFGEKLKAKSLLAGGQSGDENSPHFFDQGEMYSKGKFKDVFYYKEDVLKHAEESYQPGKRKQ